MHHTSYWLAIAELYPEYGITWQKKETVTRRYWRSLDNQRAFFDKIASELDILRSVILRLQTKVCKISQHGKELV
jgi:hypothetical protein